MVFFWKYIHVISTQIKVYSCIYVISIFILSLYNSVRQCRSSERDTKDEQIETAGDHTIDVERKNQLNIQKSLEILEITDDCDDKDLEVSFEKPNFTESEHENYRTPNENFMEPLNEAVAEQIDQLIAKLADCVDADVQVLFYYLYWAVRGVMFPGNKYIQILLF